MMYHFTLVWSLAQALVSDPEALMHEALTPDPEALKLVRQQGNSWKLSAKGEDQPKRTWDRRSPGCGGQLPNPASAGFVTHDHVVQVNDPLIDEGSRTFSLFVPSSYDPAQAHPLFLDFHGFGDNSRLEASQDGLFLTAERQGFLIAYPKGMTDVLDSENDGYHYYYYYDYYKQYFTYYYYNSWNGGGTNGTNGAYGRVCEANHYTYPCYESCMKAGLCTTASVNSSRFCGSSSCADDVGFVEALLDHLMSNYCVDTEQVHGTGMSNGGIFLYYLASTETGKRFASMIPVAASPMLGHSTTPAKPIALMDIHSVYDSIVPANVTNSWGRYKEEGCPVHDAGKQGCTVSADGFYYTPVNKVLRNWASTNGCELQENALPTTDEFDGHTSFRCATLVGPSCKYPVLRCTHDLQYNSGHTWPFHEAQPGFARTERFGNLLWWFASQYQALLTQTSLSVALPFGELVRGQALDGETSRAC